MSHRVLERLKSESYLLKFGLIAIPSAVHRALELSDEVAQVRKALSQGEIDEESIRRFVSELLAELRIGRLFPYDLSLAALAVAIQSRATAFAEEVLLDLARLELAEIPMAVRVARHSARIHSQMARNQTAVCTLVAPEEMPTEWKEAPRFVERETSHDEKRFAYGAA